MGRSRLDDGKSKRCADCKKVKLLSEFYLSSKKMTNGEVKQFYNSYCRKCHGIRNRASFENDRESRLASQRALTATWKRRAMDGYGGTCACCGEDEIDFLCIDHVNNDGKAHRKEMGTAGGVTLYRQVVRLGFPDRFQVLCFNCNNAKYQRGICPHQLQLVETTGDYHPGRWG